MDRGRDRDRDRDWDRAPAYDSRAPYDYEQDRYRQPPPDMYYAQGQYDAPAPAPYDGGRPQENWSRYDPPAAAHHAAPSVAAAAAMVPAGQDAPAAAPAAAEPAPRYDERYVRYVFEENERLRAENAELRRLLYGPSAAAPAVRPVPPQEGRGPGFDLTVTAGGARCGAAAAVRRTQ
jgi:hypothetical protein